MRELAVYKNVHPGDVVCDTLGQSLPLTVTEKTEFLVVLYCGTERHGFSAAKFDAMEFVHLRDG